MVKVIVIAQRGQSVLVEYRDLAGALHRVYVPAQTLTQRDDTNGADVDGDELDAGIEYGESWESMPLGRVSAEQIANALRERNIWTKDDLKRNLSQVRAALQTVYAKDFETLLHSARNGADGELTNIRDGAA